MNLSLLLIIISSLIDVANTSSTVVALTDAELEGFLQLVFREIGNSNLISITLLQSLGLDTASVIDLLIRLGYTILW